MKKSVKITFVSNYINHHQIPFCEALHNRSDCDFCFVQTQEMEQKRIDMGWGVDVNNLSYVTEAYANSRKAYEAVMNSDILLIGWNEDESLIYDALEEVRKDRSSRRLVIRISERLYREGQWRAISPKGLLRKYREHIRYRRSPVYLLCNGAYVASDYALIGAYPGKRYKFGYFPATRRYEDPEDLFKKKPALKRIDPGNTEELPTEPPVLTDHNIEIVWVGRLIPLKHPEYMIKMADELCRCGYRFHITIVGDGRLMDELQTEASDRMVDDYITFAGMRSPEEARDIMEKSHIHIFTSNYLEGWGAVVNEGMNAGCAEVVSENTGVGPYLIENGVSGLLYKDDSYSAMVGCVLKLLDEPELIEQYGRKAYDRIAGLWNAEVAAERLIKFHEGYLAGHITAQKDGPFSEAFIIKPDFWAKGRLTD